MLGAITYAPATFAERGAAVGFTTPLLSQTRVRRDERQRLEVLISSFAEGRGIYVVPWRVVPEMVSMTAHDRYLHSLISREGIASPSEIRKAALKTARNGLAGPKGVAAARSAIAEDEEHRTVTNFLLIVEVLRTAGLDARALVRAGFDTDEGKKITRGYMASAAESLGIDSAELYRRVAEMADVMSPIGLIQAPKPGRLRHRLKDLEFFRDEVGSWSRVDESDTAHVAAFCAGVASDTLALGKELLGDFDRRAASIGPMIRDWNHQITTVRETAERLTWLVDGWDFMAKAWQDALQRDQHEQRMAINELFRVLPIIPRSESRYDHSKAAAEVLLKHRRSVRAFEDWRTGRLDADMIHRIETINAKPSNGDMAAAA